MADEAISDISICSSALIKLGQEPIQSLSDDTKNARMCNNRFAYIRNSVLESYEWSFATKIADLALLSIPTPPTLSINPNLPYLYAAPADLLKIIHGSDLYDDYELADGVIYGRYSPMSIKYTWHNTNSASYSYCGAECIAWRLAADLAYALTNSQPTAEAMAKGYEMELRNARYSDSHKKNPQTLVADDCIRSRF